MYLNDLYLETCSPITFEAHQKLQQISVLNTFLKSHIYSQILAPPENHVQIFENEKWKNE